MHQAHTDSSPTGVGLKVLTAAAILTALIALPGLALAKSPAAARETIAPAFQHAIPNIPGKSIIAVVVSYPPGVKTPPHRHAGSAFIVGYVLSGSIRSQVDDGEARVFHAGESFSEAPGAHHTMSENASATKPAKLLAIFVVDTDAKDLTTIDQP